MEANAMNIYNSSFTILNIERRVRRINRFGIYIYIFLFSVHDRSRTPPRYEHKYIRKTETDALWQIDAWINYVVPRCFVWVPCLLLQNSIVLLRDCEEHLKTSPRLARSFNQLKTEQVRVTKTANATHTPRGSIYENTERTHRAGSVALGFVFIFGPRYISPPRWTFDVRWTEKFTRHTDHRTLNAECGGIQHVLSFIVYSFFLSPTPNRNNHPTNQNKQNQQRTRFDKRRQCCAVSCPPCVCFSETVFCSILGGLSETSQDATTTTGLYVASAFLFFFGQPYVLPPRSTFDNCSYYLKFRNVW